MNDDTSHGNPERIPDVEYPDLAAMSWPVIPQPRRSPESD
ncbi:hypothetical protein JD82_04190 [Prauserella rugosa]|uniref:Uncharacterized protein n=1 Tax=Prauserella rugosa TaxID=43354 RepID=A0A660CL04_9PSEU|nr:hypothetical protein HQ32_00483 [Prauserella sp. Am3]TWH22313.1 hypothetical protein JD82_04190 [Prauserella rugosa]